MRTGVGLTLAFAAVTSSGVRADFITSAAGLTDAKIVTFSQFSSGFAFGPGPAAVGGLVGERITFSSSNAATNGGAFLGTGTYRISPNGTWDRGRGGFVGLNAGVGTITIAFLDAPVAQVGGFLNYAVSPGLPDVTVAVLAADGTVLESDNLAQLAPISTPGTTNSGAFRGISRTQADIYGFRVANSFVVLDDLTFSRTPGVAPVNPVPGPATIVLGLVGVLSAGLGRFVRSGRRVALV